MLYYFLNTEGNMSKIKNLNHITLICKDLEKSTKLFIELFEAVEIYSSERKNFSVSTEKFFLIEDLWIAIMEGPSINPTYNHIAFSIEEKDLPFFEAKIQELGLEIKPARERDPQEGKSLYFYDYDNHLFELHTGNLHTRLRYYQSFDPRKTTP